MFCNTLVASIAGPIKLAQTPANGNLPIYSTVRTASRSHLSGCLNAAPRRPGRSTILHLIICPNFCVFLVRHRYLLKCTSFFSISSTCSSGMLVRIAVLHSFSHLQGFFFSSPPFEDQCLNRVKHSGIVDCHY